MPPGIIWRGENNDLHHSPTNPFPPTAIKNYSLTIGRPMERLAHVD